MDIQMPVMDGYAATRAIRALEDPVLASTPVIVMTQTMADVLRRHDGGTEESDR